MNWSGNDENYKAEMEFTEYLMGCVDTQKDALLSYCVIAYTKFFDNGQESIDTNELSGILCQERLITEQSINLMLEEMDNTKNGSIQYFEFYEVLIRALRPEDPLTGEEVTLDMIENHLQKTLNNPAIGLTKTI